MLYVYIPTAFLHNPPIQEATVLILQCLRSILVENRHIWFNVVFFQTIDQVLVVLDPFRVYPTLECSLCNKRAYMCQN
uniref:Uncharacterized protein n=1 Tax=Arundo donax TaxID=35708 RepID=A0A0A9CY51_ARUDO